MAANKPDAQDNSAAKPGGEEPDADDPAPSGSARKGTEQFVPSPRQRQEGLTPDELNTTNDK